LVWADGQVWNHGRNAPPEHGFALAYERQCDYVSGCVLTIRRQLWMQLEGLSHSRSTEQGLKTHQLCNLEQLQQQWQFTLDTEQPPAGHP
jgi:hypothetical protein